MPGMVTSTALDVAGGSCFTGGIDGRVVQWNMPPKGSTLCVMTAVTFGWEDEACVLLLVVFVSKIVVSYLTVA